jgi:hypothetical protein
VGDVTRHAALAARRVRRHAAPLAHLAGVMNRYGRSHPTGMLTVPGGALEAEVAFTERTVAGMLREPPCSGLRAVKP